ncbi:L,D-transpeptidase family protein [Allosphingosinicella sp.]|uniref:L,D-transpeptidase family protein n=1 Tax=Allosphingosinicella sp. TaxID=2823234 RepID=UPI003784989F
MLRVASLLRRALALGLLAMAAPLAAGAQVTVSMETGQLLANDGLRPGQSRWQPEAATATGAISIVVSVSLQRAYVFRGTTLIGVTTVSTGQPGYDTPTGRYRILEKQVTHHSSLYENAPMPFMQRLTGDGIALHAGVIARSGNPVSHGCIRLPPAFAQRLYGMTAIGTVVIVTDETPNTPEEALTLAMANPSL